MGKCLMVDSAIEGQKQRGSESNCLPIFLNQLENNSTLTLISLQAYLCTDVLADLHDWLDAEELLDNSTLTLAGSRRPCLGELGQ